jgi:transposase
MSYSNDLRLRAVHHYLNVHRNYKAVSKLFKVGIATLHDWVRRFRASGSIPCNNPPGRPRTVSGVQENEFYNMVLANADCTLEKLSEKWQEKSGTQVSGMTIWRTIRRLRLTYKKNFQSL